MRPCLDHDDLGCPMTHINRVDGEGPIPCSILLIGEAPGKTEDKRGKPFIGKSGSELTHLYLGKCARINRENVYVTNLVKCRTNEKDRDPTDTEMRACGSLLADEIVINVLPRFIGVVGSISTRWLMGADARMDKMHGFGYHYDISLFECLVMPLYHPAFGLHNTAMIRHIMDDWERFGKMVRGDESVMWRAR